MKISDYFRIVMIKKNIDMSRLSKDTNINYKTLSGKFSRNSFGDETLIKICVILDVELKDLARIIEKEN